MLLEVAALAALNAGCSRGDQTRDNGPSASAASPPPKLPPPQPPAPARSAPTAPRLLRGALFTSAAAHPTEALLATASATISDDTPGQVVVWDLRGGKPLHVYDAPHGAGGWDGHSNLLQFSPDGARVAVAEGTNGITVLEASRAIGEIHLDPGRDEPVDFCWADAGATLFVAAASPAGDAIGALVDAKSVAFKETPRWVVAPSQRHLPWRMVWNPRLDAIVAFDANMMLAFDVKTGKLRYEVPIGTDRPAKLFDGVLRPAWSPDGERIAIAEASGVSLHAADDGKRVATVPVPGVMERMHFGRSGRLAVVGRPGPKEAAQILVVERGQIIQRLSAPLLRAGPELQDAPPLAFSPDGDTLALRVDGQRVLLVDVKSGNTKGTVIDRVPPDETEHGHSGLVWGHGDRLVGLSRERVVFWASDGSVIAEYSVG